MSSMKRKRRPSWCCGTRALDDLSLYLIASKSPPLAAAGLTALSAWVSRGSVGSELRRKTDGTELDV